MVCPNDIQVRQQLELLYQQSPAVPVYVQFLEFFQHLGQALVTELTRDHNEPRISKDYTIEGKAIWHVYDPLSRQRVTVHSEQAVREWLEQRYSL